MTLGYLASDLEGKVDPALVAEVQQAHDAFAAAQIALGRRIVSGGSKAAVARATHAANSARDRWLAVQARVQLLDNL